MKVVCTHCSRKIEIPDAKVPKGKAFSITCPQCKNKVAVNPDAPAAPQKPAAPPPKKADAPPSAPPAKKDPPQKPAAPAPAAEKTADDDDSGGGGGPFDFLEEGAKTAVICEEDDKNRAIIRKVLEDMNYHIMEAPNPRETLKNMRYHIFDVVVINELFGSRDPDMNHVLKYMSQLPMLTRRNMFVCMLSDRFRTGDNMQAFHKSVNVIINISDMNRLAKLLEHYIKDNDSFYKVYRDIFARIKGA